MITVNDVRVWWDSTQGSYCADGFIGGLGQYVTVQSIATAAGVTLTAEEEAVLKAEFDNRPADDSYSAAARLSKGDFMDRFTADELTALYTAAKTIVQIEVWLDRFKVRDYIDLSDPRTAEGVHALEYVGILAAGRAAQILKV